MPRRYCHTPGVNRNNDTGKKDRKIIVIKSVILRYYFFLSPLNLRFIHLKMKESTFVKASILDRSDQELWNAVFNALLRCHVKTIIVKIKM